MGNVVALPSLGLLLAASCSIPALASDCGIVKEAVIAQTKVSYAATVVMTLPGEPTTTAQTIASGEKVYFLFKGAWQSSPRNAQEEIDKVNSAAKTGTCAHESDDTINGESVGVYTLRYQTPHSESNNRLWISKATGLPLKTEAVLTSKTTISITFRYDNIKPPPGAN
jgi:outer membrane lipoprotein-sorting protein